MVEISIGLVVVSAICIFLYMMAKVAVRPKVHTLDYEKNKLVQLEVMRGENICIDEEYSVKTFDGLTLWAGLVKSEIPSNRYVVLSHGYTSTRYGIYKYAALWKKLGYNCVLYENRGHGVNEPATVTFGKVESKDLITVIEDTYQRYGTDIRIGLHGESMGAGLQLMALRYQPKVDFIVNDCGYSEILPVLRWKVQQAFHMPSCLPILASPFARIFFGFWFQEVRPIDELKENEVPICFVHGIDDTFTHKWHSEKMYEANKGYKELHLFESADHAECIALDPARYKKMLEGFLQNVYKEK